MGENGGGRRVWMQMKNVSRGWCNFGECSRKTRPCHDFCPTKHLKYGQGENASLCDIGLEKQEQEISRKRSGEVQVGTGCKGKRSRCLQLPEGANSGLNHSVLRPQSIKIQSDIFEENISSTSTKSDSAAIDSEDPDRDEVQQPSMPRSRDLGQQRTGKFKEHNEPHCSTVSPPKDPVVEEDAVRGQKLKLKMELKTRDLSRRTVVLPLGNVTLNLTADLEDQSVDEDCLGFGAGEIHRCNGMETALIDVHLTVQASHRSEHVPFVCLVSKLNRKAIMGHPVEIEEIADSSRTCPKFHQLFWRTSKRSPVVYVTNSCASSIAVDKQALQGSLSLRGNVVASEQKFPKKPGQFKQGTVLLRRTCVPVKHIISKILIAVGS